MKKLLVIAHVFYPEHWSGLVRCIRNSPIPCDLVVTYVDEQAVIAAKRDFPEAKFIFCENRGYDVWPFLKALGSVDLSQYDLVLKLHTKRDVAQAFSVDGVCYAGGCWREHLLAPFATEADFARSLARIGGKDVGMVADRRVIFTLGAHEDDESVIGRLAGRNPGFDIADARKVKYVAGTMFLAKAKAFLPLVRAGLTAEDFEPPAKGDFTTLAHVLEREFGLLVYSAGMKVLPYRGNKFTSFLGWLGGRFFRVEFRNGQRKVKVLGITVRREPISTEVSK